MINSDAYKQAEILPDNEQAVKTAIESWALSNIDEATRNSDLEALKKYKTQCVGYLMENLPDGVIRVDGYCISTAMLFSVLDSLRVPEPEPAADPENSGTDQEAI